MKTIEDLKNKIKVNSYEFKSDDGIVYESAITVSDVLRLIDEYFNNANSKLRK